MLPDSEERWIRKIQRGGDKDAADALIRKYYHEIYAYVYRQTSDKMSSMDLTQEIFISMLKSIGGFDRRKSGFRTWLYRIATNKVVDSYRSRHYRQRLLTVDIESMEISDDSDLAGKLEQRESAQKVLEAVGRLNVRTQQILRLKLFGGSTFAQIAETFSLPEGTVKSCYYAAIRAVKKEMEGQS